MKRCVYITVGYPGSGKTTWAKAFEGAYIGIDDLRRQIFGTEGAENAYLRERFWNIVSYFMFTNQRCIVDDNHLTPDDRWQWLSLAHDFGVKIVARVFNVPWEVCRKRRPGIGSFEGRLVIPTKEEGFSEIEVWTPPFA